MDKELDFDFDFELVSKVSQTSSQYTSLLVGGLRLYTLLVFSILWWFRGVEYYRVNNRNERSTTLAITMVNIL